MEKVRKETETSWKETLSQKSYKVLLFLKLTTISTSSPRAYRSDRIYLIDDNDTTTIQVCVNNPDITSGREKFCTFTRGLVGVLLMFVGLLLLFLSFRGSSDGLNFTLKEDGREMELIEKKCDTPICQKVGKEVASFMDQSAAPCQDFDRYACGEWAKLHPVQPEDPDNTISVLSEMTKQNTKVIRDILESPQRLDGAGEKARDFYVSCINKKKLDSKTTIRHWISEPDDVTKSNDEEYDDDNSWLDLSRLEKSFPNIRTRVKPFLEIEDKSDSVSFACVTLTQTSFPDVTGRLFVQKTYTTEKMERVKYMLDEIKEMFRKKVDKLSWMDELTKKHVISKLGNTVYQLGYPASILNITKEIENYEGVSISRAATSYSDNIDALEVNNVLNYFDLSDTNEIMFATEGNAVYQYWKDMLYIPAGITMEPFFSIEYPDIINYAKFALTLGHEYSHAFEEYVRGNGTWGDHGRKPYGISTSSYLNFDKVRKCLQNQYNHFSITNSTIRPNGTITWDENFADVSGLQLAFDIFQEKYRESYLPLPHLENMSPEQVFFIAAAQEECRSFTGEAARQRVLQKYVDLETHSPNSVRVLGEMTNNEEFAKAFQCPMGSQYNPEKKCKIFY